LAEAAEFDYSIENLEPLGFVLHGMLKRLTERLQLRGLAAGDLTLSLGLVDHARDDRRVAVAAATVEPRSLLTLLKLSLEKTPPPAAVEAVRLNVEVRALRPAQNDLFLPPSPAPDRLEATLARIAALCGPEQVGSLVAAESYRPEAVRLHKFLPPSPPASPTGKREKSSEEREEEKTCSFPSSGGGRRNSAPIVLRTIRPAEEVEVMCIRNTPEFVRGNNICARVVSSAGPWRRQGEWWAQFLADFAGNSWQATAPVAYTRDYYELALAGGAVYRVYCELSSGKWFADGIYD